jgi:glycosyltransferase involved in cell wall biosynthesis
MKSDSKRTTVSVIVPTYNRKELMKKTLESLSKQEYPQNKYEIIVVDDGSTDGTKDMVLRMKEKSPSPIRYLRQKNQGAARARNLGIKNAKGFIIGFTDSDAIPRRDWIKNSVKYFEKSNVGGVEGKVITDEDVITPFTHQVINKKSGLYPTCNMFYLKSVLDEIDGFDERFKDPFREDTDLAFTVLKKGYDIPFGQDLIVCHPPRAVSYLHPLKRTKLRMYDPLLYKKHKTLYRNYRSTPFPVSYYLVLFFEISAILSMIFIFLFFLASYYALKIPRGSRNIIKKPWLMIITIVIFMALPPLEYIFLLYGNIKFRKILLY